MAWTNGLEGRPAQSGSIGIPQELGEKREACTTPSLLCRLDWLSPLVVFEEREGHVGGRVATRFRVRGLGSRQCSLFRVRGSACR